MRGYQCSSVFTRHWRLGGRRLFTTIVTNAMQLECGMEVASRQKAGPFWARRLRRGVLLIVAECSSRCEESEPAKWETYSIIRRDFGFNGTCLSFLVTMAFNSSFHVVIGRRRGCSSASTADEEKYTSADASGKVVFLCGHYRMYLLWICSHSRSLCGFFVLSL